MAEMYDWNAGSTRSVPPRLVDETLRDGLQSVSVRDPSLEAKRELVHYMARLSIDSAALGFPASSARQYEHVQALAKEIASARLGLVPCAAARTVIRDIEPICEISERAGIPIQVGMFIGSSPIRQHVEGWSVDDLLRRTEQAVSFAVRHGLPVLFVTEDTTRSEPVTLSRLYSVAVRAGARQVCIADTVGCVTPAGATAIVRFIREVIDVCAPGVGIDWHGHGDRGLALAASLAAWEAGADRCHGTVLGVGERTGNTPIELLLVNLMLSGQRELDLRELPQYVQAATEALAISIPNHHPVVGRDAFRTATGVHAAAIAKAKSSSDTSLMDNVYSSVPAWRVGREQSIDVGPLSGLSNVELWFSERGYQCDRETLEAILDVAKQSDHVLTESELLECLRIERDDRAPSGVYRLEDPTEQAGHSRVKRENAYGMVRG